MTEIQVHKVSLNEIKQLQHISRVTFAETFSSGNSEEDLQKYLHNAFSSEKLENELSDKYSEFYLAKQDGNIIGYLKVNFGPSQTELKHENALEIERIYVLKEFHGKKAGQLLFRKALNLAKQKQVDFIWLGVWEKNPRAIRFYEKNGFIQFDKHVFKLGDDEQTDIMMKRKLN